MDKPTPPCAGDWILNTTSNVCEYQCSEIGQTQPHTPEEIDQTAQYCLNTYTDANDVNQCCDEYLKHPLSLGPNPGYPDCIGKWSLAPGTNTCQFACVSQEQMIEILKQLKENAPIQQ